MACGTTEELAEKGLSWPHALQYIVVQTWVVRLKTLLPSSGSNGPVSRLHRPFNHSIMHHSSKSGAQERQKSSLFCISQIERSDVLIQVGVLVAASIVVFDYVFEGCQTSIVHIRAASPDITQGRSLECAFVVRLAGDACASFILQCVVAPGDA